MKTLIATAAGMGLMLAACSSADTDSDAPPTATASPTAVESDDLDRVVTAVSAVGSVRYTLTQTFDDETERLEVTVGGLDSDDPADVVIEIVAESGDRTEAFLVVDGSYYSDVSDLDDVDARWARGELDEARLEGLYGVTPAGFMNEFKNSLVSFEADGEPEEIDGVLVQAFSVVMDPELSALTGLSARDDGEPPVGTLWVDENDLPVRLVATDAVGEYELTFGGWNEDVDVEAPPAADVVMLEELAPSLE